MVSRKNIKYKMQQDAKCVPHYGIRKLSIGVASVLLGTVFYMQNGTVHAAVNPTVSSGNVNVVDKNSGTSGSAGVAGTSTGASSAGSVGSMVSAGDAANSAVPSQASGSPVEGATKQANNTALTVSEPESSTPASQVNVDTDNSISSLPPASHHQAASGNQSNERLSANLSLPVNQNSNFNISSLLASKVALTGSNNVVNGGFDQSAWGKLDVNAWKGSVQGDYYQLTDYTGDANHVIVPNEADFAKAGISTFGKQVGVTSDLMHTIFRDKTTAQDATVAFSKTDNKQVKAINADWDNTWGHAYEFVHGSYIYSKGKLTKFDGSNLDVANITNMQTMFRKNQISDLSSLANWKTDNVTNMNWMFSYNHISDLSPLTNWKVDNVTNMSHMFDDNVTTQTKNLQAKRVINFVYPDGYTGKKQDPVTQTVNVPTKQVKVELTTKDSKPSNNILDWVTKTETPETPAPVYFKDYTVPEIKGLLEPDKTVIARQHADITKPINVTVTYKLVESDTNDAFALDSKNGLHEHANVNDNGGYDEDYWGTLDVSKFTTVKNGDNLEITGYTGDVSKVIIPNIADFEINNLDQGAKQVTISSSVMLSLAQNATRIGLSKTNNQKVVASDTNWSNAFKGYYNELNLMDLHNLDTTNITNMSSMFYGGSNLKVVGDLSQWNTANVTNMSQMFRQASALTNIGDLSQWNTSKVTDMSAMFSRAFALTNIGDLSQWNTFKVTDMHSMFVLASGLTNIGDLSQWNTAKVTDMSYMFCSASGLTNIGDLDNWDTSKVTDMNHMFQEASSLTNIGNLSKWDVSNVTNMDSMFQQASSLTNIGDLDNWNTSKVTDMGWMFDQAFALTNIGDLNKWNTAKVTEMGCMFSNASALTNIGDLSKWNVSNVFDMNGMFQEASSLTNIGDLSKWDVSNVASMDAMFGLASELTNIGDLSKWDVSNVFEMRGMFYKATALKQLNISNWNLTNLRDKEYFQLFVTGDPNLVVIANNVKLPTWYQNELNNSNDFWNDHLAVITNNESLLKASGSVDDVTVDKASVKRSVFYDSKGSDDAVAVLKQADQAYIKQYQNEHPGDILTLASDVDQMDPIALANAKFVVKRTLSELDTNDAFALNLANGLHEHKNVNDNGGYDTDFWGTLNVSNFTTVKNGDNLEITGYTGDAAKVIIPNIADFWVNKLDQGAKQVTINSSVMRKLVKNATRIGLSKTNNQKVVAGDSVWQDAFGGMTNEPNTSSNASGGMWVYNPNLTTMDLHNLDTTNITDMSAMFNGGRNLKVVGDLSQWNVANVVSMNVMFQRASNLTYIGNLDNWDTSEVTDMNRMFIYATDLTNIGDLSKWKTGNVTNMNSMFYNATNLTNIGDLSNWNTSKVTNMCWMFGNATNLTNIGNLDNWNTSNVTDMSHMFANAANLTNIGDLSKWKTGNVTNMNNMFYNATSLTNIGNLDNWDTSNVTNMNWMFGTDTDTGKQSHLTNIGDLSKWQTSNVTNMNSMFSNAINLTNIGDLSKWNTSKVTDMHCMFANATSLINVGDLSKWQTGNVTDMSGMFGNATDLTNIGNLDNWNTSKVTDMSWMFGTGTDTGKQSHLTNIGDLSKWQTGNVTNIAYMFASTEALRHLNISNWDLTKLANKDAMKYMFANDTDLTIIANDLALPVWYQNEINDANYFWNNHMAVITNVPELIKSTGAIDNLKIDNQDASRSIFYDSKGSSDAVAVLKQANQAYVKQYQNEHPGYTLNLAADVDQIDPIALANAKFVSAPLDVQFNLAYYDLTGKLIGTITSTHKVGDTVSISPVVPDNYVLANGQLGMNYLMRWGLNEADFLVEPKLTQTTETKTVFRTIKIQTPDGQFNNVVQTVTFVRNSYLNHVTKQTTYSPWSFGGQYQFSGYQPKPMGGYTVDVIPAVIVTPDSLNTTVNVVYHKIPVVYEIDYQLANGTVVKNVSATPERDGTIHLTAPQGYRLLTPVTDVQVGHNSQKLKVLVLPDEQTYTAYSALPSSITEPLTKTITRTINITMPNGRVRRVVQQVHFIRTATVAANGKITYSNWTGVGQTSFDRLFVPKRRGYRLVMTDNQDQTLIGVNQLVVDPTMDNVVINVKYVK